MARRKRVVRSNDSAFRDLPTVEQAETLRREGWRPYVVVAGVGELVSYPYPEDGGGGVSVFARSVPGDATTARHVRIVGPVRDRDGGTWIALGLFVACSEGETFTREGVEARRGPLEVV